MDAQERENALSVRRSTVAAHRDGPAGDTDTPESVRNVIASPGQSLDTSIQRAMEDRMGDSLGDVRVHTGPQAAKACEAINARAFTVGNHIAFNHGEYDPPVRAVSTCLPTNSRTCASRLVGRCRCSPKRIWS